MDNPRVMAPVEWPLAARSADRAANPTRRVDRDRLSTVRADFFLDPGARLTEQERALMTALLADLVAMLADEIRAEAELPPVAPAMTAERCSSAWRSSGLLDIPDLIALLLRRAEQERVADAIGARGRRRPRRVSSMSLPASSDADVSAAAMAVILGRSRRRDRFDAPANRSRRRPRRRGACAWSMRSAPRFATERRRRKATAGCADAAAALLPRHDEGKRMEALSFALVHALDRRRPLDDETFARRPRRGRGGAFAEALARRAGVDCETAWAHFVGGDRSLACLLRMAGVTRAFAATIAATVGDSIAGAAAAIGRFDSMSGEEVERSRARLRLDRHYRDAIAALGGTDGYAARPKPGR